MKLRDDSVLLTSLSRREFLWTMGILSAGSYLGCAVNPVTGKQQVMLVSEEREIHMDKTSSPHQFSADYGQVQDGKLNGYLTEVGMQIAKISHRPQMPYSFRCVNAAYINAYAFPGGSIATTRGILLNLESEDELAALLGHEIGHVNARHTAERMSKNMLLGSALALGTAYVQAAHEQYSDLAASLGGVGAGLLLAKYSRDDERQADDLGMSYMAKANYNPAGMADLMEMLQSMSKHKPSAIEMMFSSHPMSDQRLSKANEKLGSKFADIKDRKIKKERYMDFTAKLRKDRKLIETIQDGERALTQKKYDQAADKLKQALKYKSSDYAALLMTAKYYLAKEKFQEAANYAKKAEQAYPGEPQALHISGVANLGRKKYNAAFNEFRKYEEKLPGNPNTIFFKGYTQEGMKHNKEAAEEYMRYLKEVNQGDQAKHAYSRLVDWGYIKPEPPQQP